ncbi:MAG TPA: helix-turn-helix domain-containing protein [Pseudonocardia sp.]|nr:helix-turn-helix domain-containing protein [Pseudonocardia sp.]
MPTEEERPDAGDEPTGLGAQLRGWRERMFLTQDELAERSGLNVRTIRRLERRDAGARPQSASLRQLAIALGLDAGEQAVLVEAARGAPVRAPWAHPVPGRGTDAPPRQLPAPPPQFTGRGRDLAALERAGEQPGAVLVGVDGMAGVGKTALAVHAAHRWSARYPDGQIFLDLQGYTRGAEPVEPADALDRLLRSLGVSGPRVPPGLDDRAALYRSRLAGRRVLVLLDNAVSESQVGPLLPGSPDCLVLVTSRRRLAGLDLTLAHSLDVLAPADAVALLVDSCGGRRAAASDAQLVELVELCGRLPLAIRIAAARLRSRPPGSVAHLVDRLRGHRLAELEAGDRSVAAALDLTYARLGPELRRTYRALALHPGADLDLDAAVALTARPVVHVRRLLDQLLDAHALYEPAPGRYRFHDLTRAHAATVANGEAARPGRSAAAGLRRHGRSAAGQRREARNWRR